MEPQPLVQQKLDGRTTRRASYWVSQRARTKIEEVIGWLKTVAGLPKARHRGTARAYRGGTFAGASYILVRLWRIIPA